MTGAGARILVIDDSKVIRTLLRDELEGRGLTVETAEDGIAGMQAGAAGNFDLILIDAMMPGLSGFDVCRRLANMRSEGRPRLVMFSNRSKDYATRQQASSAGADAFVAKRATALLADDVLQLL